MNEEDYRPLLPCLTIGKSTMLSNITGRDELGLFAAEDIPSGTVLGVSHVKFGEGDNVVWIRTPLGGFYNHSATQFNCESYEGLYSRTNGEVVEDVFIKKIQVMKSIRKGTEILLKYTLYDPTK